MDVAGELDEHRAVNVERVVVAVLVRVLMIGRDRWCNSTEMLSLLLILSLGTVLSVSLLYTYRGKLRQRSKTHARCIWSTARRLTAVHMCRDKQTEFLC